MSKRCLVLLVLVCVAMPGRAVEPPERLLEQLGSARHREREQAAAGLLQQGSVVIPLLEKARGHHDPEIRRQVENLLDHLIPRAEAEVALAPQKIRLNYKDVPITEALTEFARKTRLPLALDSEERPRLARKRLTLQTEELTYWEAYRRLCVAAGLYEVSGPLLTTGSLYPLWTTEWMPRTSSGPSRSSGSRYGAPGATRPLTAPLVLRIGPAVAHPATVSGALRIQTLDSQVPRTGSGEATVAVLFTAEDRVRLLQVEYLRVEKAVDIFGTKLCTTGYVPEVPLGVEYSLDEVDRPRPMRYLPPTQIALRFQAVNQRSKVVAELTGFVGLRIEAPAAPLVEVSDVIKAVNTTSTGRDGTTVKIVSAEIDPDTKRLRMKVEIQRAAETSDPARAPAQQMGRGLRPGSSLLRSDLEQQGVMLVDGKGEQVTLFRAELTRREQPAPRDYTLVYEPTREQAAAGLRLVVSGRRRTLVEVPFTLRNIPLP